MESGLVYVVYNEWIKNPQNNEMPYKIGITKRKVSDRYYGLDLKMPGKFKCLFAYNFPQKSPVKIEQTLHSIFGDYRINGEWFNLTQKKLDLIKANCEEMGGILITEEIESEIEGDKINETETEKTAHQIILKKSDNNIFNDLIEIYNKKYLYKIDISDINEKYAYAAIHIDGWYRTIHYEYLINKIKNPEYINIELHCEKDASDGLKEVFKEFDGIKIDKYTLSCVPRKHFGRLCPNIKMEIPVSEGLENFASYMDKFINKTIERVKIVARK